MLPCCEYEGRTAAYHRGRTPGRGYQNKIIEDLEKFERQFIDDDKIDSKGLCEAVSKYLKELTEELCNDPNGLNQTTPKDCDDMPEGNCTVKCS